VHLIGFKVSDEHVAVLIYNYSTSIGSALAVNLALIVRPSTPQVPRLEEALSVVAVIEGSLTE